MRISSTHQWRRVHQFDAGYISDADPVERHDGVAGAGGDDEDVGVVVEVA